MDYKYFTSIVVMFFLCATYKLSGQDKCTSQCGCGITDISPAGLMYSQVHDKGKWMASYNYSWALMQHSILGDSKISNTDIMDRYNYIMTADKMSMEMHMIMVMYGITDQFTIMLMSSWNNAMMNMTMQGNNTVMNMPDMPAGAVMPQRQTISGIGDTKLIGLFRIIKSEKYQLIISAGVSIPTGSVSRKAYINIYPDVHADYNMQPGTGAVQLTAGGSVLIHSQLIDYGLNAQAILSPFFNSDGYHYGNEVGLNLWAGHKWITWLSNSVRLETIADGIMKGSDANIYSVMEPSANSANYGGLRTMIYPGINFYPNLFKHDETNIRLEYGLPLYQYAQGIQLAGKSGIMAKLEILF
jgi:hypothetical protein